MPSEPAPRRVLRQPPDPDLAEADRVAVVLQRNRQAVGVRLEGLIEALYDGSPVDAAVLSKAEPGSLGDSFLFAGEAARD